MLFVEKTEILKPIWDPEWWNSVWGESIMSWIVIFILLVLAIIVGIVFRHKDPTKPEKGLAFIVVFIVEKIDGMVENLMGPKYKNFGGYILPVTLYIGLSFLIGLIGFPNPLSFLGNTLVLGICTFLWIHITAIRANKWKYFHRYVEPFAFFLPINLLGMWAPLLSLSLRIFGNALAGYTLMSIVYWALGGLSGKIFSFIGISGVASGIIPPIITPVLHAYFDAFSGMIQTLIFIMLTMILVSQEDPDPTIG